MAVPPLLAPKYTPAQAASRARAFGQMFVLPNDVCWCPLEPQPCEIPAKSAHERLNKRKDHHQQARVHRVEFWFDPGPNHVRKRHAKSATQHQVRNNAQPGQKNSETKKKNRQSKPFNADEVCRNVLLWSDI